MCNQPLALHALGTMQVKNEGASRTAAKIPIQFRKRGDDNPKTRPPSATEDARGVTVASFILSYHTFAACI